MQPNLGIGRRFGSHLYAGAGRDLKEGLNRVWSTYAINPVFLMSWESGVTQAKKERNEGSITYRAHEYFSVELVTDFRTDVWLRFVANL
jgi:hypothetical protein